MKGPRTPERRARRYGVTLLAAIWLATPGFAQRDLTADPGYVDLGGLGLQREEASLEIALGGV
jgi:hypothetical protein